MPDGSRERAQRIGAQRKVKGAIAALRSAQRALGAYESMEDADIIGVVQVRFEEPEVAYAADLLDMVREAVAGCGASRGIDVVVTSVPTSQSPNEGTDEGAPDGTEGLQRNGARAGA